MTKADIVNSVSSATGLTKVETEAVLEGVIKSIIDSCQTNIFDRLRFGIGRPDHGNEVDYVLGKPESRDVSEINTSLENSIDALGFYLDNGISATMDKYN